MEKRIHRPDTGHRHGHRPPPRAPGAVRPAAAWMLAAGALSAQTPDPAHEEDIRPPRESVEVPKSWGEIARENESTILLGSCALAGVVVLVIALVIWRKRWMKRRRPGPQDIALASLIDLEAGCDLLTAETFANRAAQVVRQYLEDRFGLVAPRRTSEEFLHDLAARDHPQLRAESDLLRGFLQSCDLAKFAAAPLDARQRGGILQSARAFIAATATPEATPKPIGTPP